MKAVLGAKVAHARSSPFSRDQARSIIGDRNSEMGFAMNTTIDFTVAYKSGTIISVLTPSGEDVTLEFVQFCTVHHLPVSSEVHVRVAILEFKKSNS